MLQIIFLFLFVFKKTIACRLLEVNNGKVLLGPKEDTPVESLNVGGTKIYRIEEIPHEELHLTDDEMLVSCAHFYKETFSTFGIPFLIKIKHGEPFSKVKGMWSNLILKMFMDCMWGAFMTFSILWATRDIIVIYRVFAILRAPIRHVNLCKKISLKFVTTFSLAPLVKEIRPFEDCGFRPNVCQ